MGALEEVYDSSKEPGVARCERNHDQAQQILEEHTPESFNKALVLLRENVKWTQSNLGHDHAASVTYQETLAFTLNEYASMLNADGKIEQARRNFEEAKNLDKKAANSRSRIEGLSPPSHDFLDTQQNLGNDCVGLGDFKEAAIIYKRNYDWRKQDPSLGEDHEDTLKAGFDLASCWHKLDDFIGAQDLNRKILATRLRLKRPTSEIVLSREALGRNQTKLSKFKSAKTLFEKNIEALKSPVSDSISLKENEEWLRMCVLGLEAEEKEQRAKEAREKAIIEKQTREKEAKEKEAKEKERVERENKEKATIEKLTREKEAKEKERVVRELMEYREKEAIRRQNERVVEENRERVLRENSENSENREKATIEKQTREKEAKEKERFERENREKATIEKQTREKEAKEKEAKEKERVEKENREKQAKVEAEIIQKGKQKEIDDKKAAEILSNDQWKQRRAYREKQAKNDNEKGNSDKGNKQWVELTTRKEMRGEEQLAKQMVEGKDARETSPSKHETEKKAWTKYALYPSQPDDYQPKPQWKPNIQKSTSENSQPISIPKPDIQFSYIHRSQTPDDSKSRSWDGNKGKLDIPPRPRSTSQFDSGGSGLAFKEPSAPLRSSNLSPPAKPQAPKPQQPIQPPFQSLWKKEMHSWREYRINTESGTSSVKIVDAGKTSPGPAKVPRNLPMIKEPASQSTPNILRSNSLSGHQDKSSSSSRPRAVSTGPIASGRGRRQQQSLFDAKEGAYDQPSINAVDDWFYYLEQQTQELLKPLRKDRCERVKIAILDTGVDLTHPRFLNKQSKRIKRIKAVEDFLDPGSTGQDTCGHGTHCLGLLRRVAPEADIYVARIVKNSEGELSQDIIAKAINRASRNGKDENGVRNWDVDIISMSCGFYFYIDKVEEAINEALRRKVLFFAAASNNGTMQNVAFPASLQGVICVNSSTADGVPSGFNPTFNALRCFSILGENVSSTWIKSEREEKRMSGTSVATPIAAAVAALLLEFALQSDPQDENIDRLLRVLLPWIKRQDGIIELFLMMSETRGKYSNIIPWKVMTSQLGRDTVANAMKIAVKNKFGPVF